MSSFFKKILRQLFPDSPQGHTVPLVSEPINRNDQERNGYFNWHQQQAFRPLLQGISDAYFRKKVLRENSEYQIHLLESPYANGFAVTYHPQIGERAFQFVFDLFKDRLLNAGYVMANSERRFYDRANYVEIVEKYYLKPPLKHWQAGELIDQKFGNITLEHVSIDGKPSYLKCQASIYADRLYQDAQPFDGLLEIIWT